MIELNNDYSEDIKADGGHPTAKPVALWQQVIERFGGRVVYEPFGGSGTTMIASANIGAKCLMIELEPKYCAVILERMATAFPSLPIHRLDAGG
jgi:DNA modification methylase